MPAVETKGMTFVLAWAPLQVLLNMIVEILYWVKVHTKCVKRYSAVPKFIGFENCGLTLKKSCQLFSKE